jgi:hypothetical protein
VNAWTVCGSKQIAADKKGTSPDRNTIGPGIFYFSGQKYFLFLKEE